MGDNILKTGLKVVNNYKIGTLLISPHKCNLTFSRQGVVA